MIAAIPDTPEGRHRACWYSRRTRDIPTDDRLTHLSRDGIRYCSQALL